jgi:hypothetical protein
VSRESVGTVAHPYSIAALSKAGESLRRAHLTLHASHALDRGPPIQLATWLGLSLIIVGALVIQVSH